MVSDRLPRMQKKIRNLSSSIMRFHPDALEVVYLNYESWTSRKINFKALQTVGISPLGGAQRP